MFRPHAEAIHAAWVERTRRRGTPAPSVGDSQHLVLLLNPGDVGRAVVGGEWRRSVGLPATSAAAAAFRDWFALLVERYLDAPAAFACA